jgi:hypothetical protein
LTAIVMNSSGGWIRSPQSLALLWAALAMSLVLGAGFLVVTARPPTAPSQHAEPLSDAQAVEQVVNSAKQIVAAAQLQDATGGYAFVSCTNEDEPPYQVALYMSFRLPHNDWVRYLHDVAAAMIADGWADSPAMAEHFGQKLTRDGVTSVFHRSLVDRRVATMRVYGECRNTADHRDDNPAWTEVSL